MTQDEIKHAFIRSLVMVEFAREHGRDLVKQVGAASAIAIMQSIGSCAHEARGLPEPSGLRIVRHDPPPADRAPEPPPAAPV